VKVPGLRRDLVIANKIACKGDLSWKL